MKTILVTAYAVNPYKGSEDGMGWNFIMQIARYQKVIAVTRINNGPHIEKYKAANPDYKEQYDNIRFVYFDWPYIFRFWKKGPLLSMIYFYGWQFTLAIWLLFKRFQFDIAHNLNFHNDWTPSFLWILGKPFVWGPIGHHPEIPKEFIQPIYGNKEYKKDQRLWKLKNAFWKYDPFLKITAARAAHVLCMNSQPPHKLHLKEQRYSIVPSVSSEDMVSTLPAKPAGFTVLSAGRFVPLKGFDLTIRSFAKFYHQLDGAAQQSSQLVLVGTGPSLPLLKAMAEEEKITDVLQIIEWIPRDQLKALYETSHLFLFPSHEGAGMVVAEAMSYGVPVLCIDNSGPGEFQHSSSGLKVPYLSYAATVQALADKMLALQANKDLYNRERQLAFERFATYFRWQVKGEALKIIYETVTSNELSDSAKAVLTNLQKVS